MVAGECLRLCVFANSAGSLAKSRRVSANFNLSLLPFSNSTTRMRCLFCHDRRRPFATLSSSIHVNHRLLVDRDHPIGSRETRDSVSCFFFFSSPSSSPYVHERVSDILCSARIRMDFCIAAYFHESEKATAIPSHSPVPRYFSR